MPRHLFAVPLLLLTAGAADAGEAASAETPLIRRTSLPVRLQVADLSRVASASFWVTADNGKTWRRFAEGFNDPAARKPPVGLFEATADGTYGFHTAAAFTDGTREPGPVDGKPPAAGCCVTIDTTAPAIAAFTVEPSRTEAAAVQVVSVAWSVTDLHLGATPCIIQASADGAWRDLAVDLSAKGSSTLSVAKAASLRLIVTDRAGNRAISQAWTPPGAPPAPPANADAPIDNAALAAAIKDLAKVPAEAAPVPTKAPATTPPPAAEKKPDDKPAEAPKPKTPPEPPPPQPTPPPVVPPGHQDVVIVAPTPAIPAPRPSGTAKSGALTPVAPSPTPATVTPVPAPRELLTGERASAALDQARAAAAANRDREALDHYRRLRESSLAATALGEELLLLHRLKRDDEAVRVATAAPSEAVDDAVRCAHARCLQSLGRHADSLTPLQGVSARGDQHREAQFLKANALLNLKRDRDATPILRHLAAGDDGWATAARALLQP